jgi:hypothetical protein
MGEGSGGTLAEVFPPKTLIKVDLSEAAFENREVLANESEEVL